MNKDQEAIMSFTQDDIHSRYWKDGVVFPLKVFEDDLFDKLKYIAKYQEFRKNCEVHRTVPIIEGNPN